MIKKITLLIAGTVCLAIPHTKAHLLPEEDHVYAVILAGGKGERLWPLSREHKPKQFLSFSDDRTLLQHTIDRISPLMPTERTWIITNHAHAEHVQEIVGPTIGGIISEPATRDTAPALLFACLTLIQQDPDALLLFLPADHYIKEEALFCQGLSKAITFIQNHNTIALLGLYPTFPATGYGYIEYEATRTNKLHKVLMYHEKPPLAKAEQYLKAGNMLWNGGYFCGKAATFIELFKEHAPWLYDQVKDYFAGNLAYDKLTRISFDHAVMEHVEGAYVLPMHITWSDIGNLETFLVAQESFQDQLENVIPINARNNLISSNSRVTALLGVDDLCIVNTDDVLLVAKRSEVEKVKQVLQKIRTMGVSACL